MSSLKCSPCGMCTNNEITVVTIVHNAVGSKSRNLIYLQRTHTMSIPVMVSFLSVLQAWDLLEIIGRELTSTV